MSRLYIALLALALTGCTLGPDFVRPESKPQSWHAPLPHGGKLENLSRWWEQFNDPLLNQLIVDAERGNPTLDQALAKVIEARTGVDGAVAGYYPGVAAGVSSTQSKSVFGPQLLRQRLDKFGFDSSWELDLLGKNRRTAEAARARLGASVANWHLARISLAAEVADAYVGLRQSEAQLDIEQQRRQSRSDTFRMIAEKQAAGLSSTVDAARSEADFADGNAAYAAKLSEYQKALNRLAALTGIEQETLKGRLDSRRAQIPLPNSIDVASVAVDALRQRPDVAAAEMELAAASAEIGARKAELLPSLTLTGSIGLNSLHVSGANLQATTWSFGPSLFIPVFDAGKRKSLVEGAEARYRYSEAGYRKAVRDAVRETEDALTRLDAANSRLEQGKVVHEKYRQIYLAAQRRSEAGMYSRLSLEEVLRSRLQAEDALAGHRREAVAAWIVLYKALGGGWDGNVNRTDLADSGDGK